MLLKVHQSHSQSRCLLIILPELYHRLVLCIAAPSFLISNIDIAKAAGSALRLNTWCVKQQLQATCVLSFPSSSTCVRQLKSIPIETCCYNSFSIMPVASRKKSSASNAAKRVDSTQSPSPGEEVSIGTPEKAPKLHKRSRSGWLLRWHHLSPVSIRSNRPINRSRLFYMSPAKEEV